MYKHVFQICGFLILIS